MMTGEMTDAEVAAQIERADRFIADFARWWRRQRLILAACAPTNKLAG